MALRDFPVSIRRHLTDTFRRILQEEAPDFISGDRDKLALIIKRGRLGNEDEYYLVRHRLDEIEAYPEHRDEAAILLGLLDGFEAIASPRS